MLIFLVQQCCTCSSWVHPETCISQRCVELRHCSTCAPSVHREAEKKKAEGPPCVSAWSSMGMAQPCSLRRQSALCITHLALTVGEQAEGSSFDWQDNISCSLAFSCLAQEAKFKYFKGWIQPLGYSAHTALNCSLFQHFMLEYVPQSFLHPLCSHLL